MEFTNKRKKEKPDTMQLAMFYEKNINLVNLREATKWASKYLGRTVTTSNISYLIQYGRIKRHGSNGMLDIDISAFNVLISNAKIYKYEVRI